MNCFNFYLVLNSSSKHPTGSISIMTRIQDELEFQYKGKVNLTENLFLVLHIIRYVIYILLPFLKSYPFSFLLQKQYSHLALFGELISNLQK